MLLDALSVQKAVEVMCIVPKRCNDMMNVGRLQGFDVSWPVIESNKNLSSWVTTLNHSYKSELSFLSIQGKIVAQGRLLLQDTFMVSDSEGALQGRIKERRVFLFEQIVIFSELLDKKRGFSMPGFLYKNSIKVRTDYGEFFTMFLCISGNDFVCVVCV